jgi:hypothetical protein
VNSATRPCSWSKLCNANLGLAPAAAMQVEACQWLPGSVEVQPDTSGECTGVKLTARGQHGDALVTFRVHPCVQTATSSDQGRQVGAYDWFLSRYC